MTETAPGWRIGVDLGGTKIEAVLIDPAGQIVFRERTPTPKGDYDGTLRAIQGLVRQAENALSRTASVGVAIPGTLSPRTGRVKNANSTWLNGRAFDHDLAQLLGRPVRTANDANCFALSEATDGAAAGANVVFGVIVGTGLGGGIVVSGHVLRGPNAIAGEWGHNPLPYPGPDEQPGPPCYCGRRGCLETWLSGPALTADHAKRNGLGASPQEIVAAAQTGDPAASMTLDLWLDRFGRALAGMINILDPDVIVFGGGLSNISALYHALPPKIIPHLFSDGFDTALRPAMHGDSSGVRGAAWLWSD